MAASIIFEVVTKAGLFLGLILFLVWWVNAGMPFYTISKR